MIIFLPTALSKHQASMLDGTRWAYMPHSRYTVLSTGHLIQAFIFVFEHRTLLHRLRQRCHGDKGLRLQPALSC